MAELDKAKVALRKLVAMSAPANGKTTSEGSKEQASQALRQLFRRNGVPKSGDEAGEMELPGSAAASSSTRRPPGSTGPVESPEELAEKMGPEPYKRPLPELPKRPLVLKEEGGFSAPMKLKVIEARKALQKKDQTVTQLTLSLKQCRKEVWKLQCEANAADMKVARLLEKREGELPEDFRDELERLKDKEEELADQLSSARANAQRWASVAKRQDAMLQQDCGMLGLHVCFGGFFLAVQDPRAMDLLDKLAIYVAAVTLLIMLAKPALPKACIVLLYAGDGSGTSTFMAIISFSASLLIVANLATVGFPLYYSAPAVAALWELFYVMERFDK
eukprot:symbB.v1.2.028999.t2/scaffold3118.1/size63164/6